MSLNQKFAAEYLGTAILVLGGCGTAVFAGTSVGFLGIALAFGLTIVAAAYGLGHISGAHLNPAVSLGVFVNGRMSMKEMLWYWVAQLLGAITAGFIIWLIAKSAFSAEQIEGCNFAANGYGAEFLGAGYRDANVWGALLTEFVLTFVFLMVILGVTDSKRSNNGLVAGLVIGLTLTLIHLISIPITNTSVNPARSISQVLYAGSATAWKQLWVFIVAPMAGAALAGWYYKFLNKGK